MRNREPKRSFNAAFCFKDAATTCKAQSFCEHEKSLVDVGIRTNISEIYTPVRFRIVKVTIAKRSLTSELMSSNIRSQGYSLGMPATSTECEAVT